MENAQSPERDPSLKLWTTHRRGPLLVCSTCTGEAAEGSTLQVDLATW